MFVCIDLAGVGIELPSKVRKRSCSLFRPVRGLYELHLQSTDKEMTPARNAIDAHAQDFVANGSRHYKSRKHLYSATLPARYSKCLVFSVFILVAELPVFPFAAVLLDPSSVNIPPHQTKLLRRDHLLFFVQYSTVLSLLLEQNIPECPRLLHRRTRSVKVPSLLLYVYKVVYLPTRPRKVTTSLAKACSTLSHLDGCVTGPYRLIYH